MGPNGLDLPKGAVARAVKLARKELFAIYQKKAGLFRISFRRVLTDYLAQALASTTATPQNAVVTAGAARSLLSTRSLTAVMMQDATLRREISALWSELVTERVRQYFDRTNSAGADPFAFVDGLCACYEQLHTVTTLQLFPKARSVCLPLLLKLLLIFFQLTNAATFALFWT